MQVNNSNGNTPLNTRSKQLYNGFEAPPNSSLLRQTLKKQKKVEQRSEKFTLPCLLILIERVETLGSSGEDEGVLL